ncbi:MAG: asparaginase [Clostridia bacterium]|nr:asparaginase [Clostridia bacterium]
MSVELIHVYRGHLIESIHRGDIVAVDSQGEIRFSYGDPYKRTFWRSAAKPFQIIPFIEAGGLKTFKITNEELALMISSHGGEKKHTSTLEILLGKMGFNQDNLDCGISEPMYGPYKNFMLKEQIPFSPLNNPCSGKHTGMLGYGTLKNMRLDNYIDKSHPIQLKMLETVSLYTHMKMDEIDVAIDGCGVPVFGMPIYNMARAYAHLTTKGPAIKKIQTAMTQAPFFVAGSQRLDTILMEETHGRILAKLGAESVYCLSLLEHQIGIAVKIEDGSYRALDRLIPDLLLKHHYISIEEHNFISKRLKTDILNHRKEIVGKLQSTL